MTLRAHRWLRRGWVLRRRLGRGAAGRGLLWLWLCLAPVWMGLSGCSRELQVLLPEADGGGVDAARADAGGLDAGAPPSGESDISSSSSHVCRLDRGALFCWGANGSGQLGDETRADSSAPIRIGQRGDWSRIEPGEGFTCGLRTDGSIHCWGENSAGQLGQGDRVDRLAPAEVLGGPWRTLSAGQSHVCAITTGDALSCWGMNFEGQIGQADPFGTPDVLSPAEVTPGTRYRAVASGDGHTCAIRLDGRILCWGRNTQAQLGIGPGSPMQVRTPTPITLADTFTRVEVTQHHSCALRDDGALFCWGEDTHGEIGQGLPVGTDTFFWDPVRVGTRVDWTELAVHWFGTCAIATDGGMHCAGRGIEGQLGRGSTAPSGVLVPVTYAGAFERAALGRFHACAQAGPTQALCWGANDSGQLGTGDTARRDLPTPTL